MSQKYAFFIFLFVFAFFLSSCLTPNPWKVESPFPQISSSFSSGQTDSSSPPFTENSFSSSAPVETSEEGITAYPSSVTQLLPKEIAFGAPGKMRIALTFDCGAGRGYIDQILQTLNEYQVPATFFVTGSWAENNPDDVRHISQLGFRIGNHTQNHLNLTEIPDEEIVKELVSVEETILELTGKSTKPLFRPPYGSRDERVLQVVAAQGYWSIYWTVDSLDWQEGHDPQWVKERILSRLDDGAIVLCHVASEYTYLVLGELIQEIRGRGFTFVSLDDFLELPP